MGIATITFTPFWSIIGHFTGCSLNHIIVALQLPYTVIKSSDNHFSLFTAFVAPALFLVPLFFFVLHLPPFFLFVCRFSVFSIDMTSHRFNDNNQVWSGAASRGDRPRNLCDRHAVVVVRYIEQYGGRRNGRDFYTMPPVGDMH